MIIEQRVLLKWITFPSKAELKPSLTHVYLQSPVQKSIWTHKVQPFDSYILHLDSSPRQRLLSYASGLRSDIQRSKNHPLNIIRHQETEGLVQLLTLTNIAKGLSEVNHGHFSSKKHFLISEIHHDQLGLLVAHAYQMDITNHLVRLDYNASAYRRYHSGTKERSLCGIANARLFDDDFTYFQKAGYRLVDWGGYGEDHGTQRFKAKFGGQIVRQYNYFPIWYYLYRKLKRV